MAVKIRKSKLGRPTEDFEKKGSTIFAKNAYLIKVGLEHDKTLSQQDAFIVGKAIVEGRDFEIE